MLDGGDHAGPVVEHDGGHRAATTRPPERHRGQADLGQRARGADRRRAGRRRARRRRGGRRRVVDRPPARRRYSGRPAARATRCGPTVRPRHRRRTPGRTGRRRAVRLVERARDPSRRTARWPTTWPLGSGASRARDAASRIRSLVAGATPGRSLRTNDTRPLETPARRATSTIVARRRLVTPRVPLEPTAASGVLAYDVTAILNRFRIPVKAPPPVASPCGRRVTCVQPRISRRWLTCGGTAAVGDEQQPPRQARGVPHLFASRVCHAQGRPPAGPPSVRKGFNRPSR